MGNFKYKAISASGAKVAGVIESESQSRAIDLLLGKGLHATEIAATADSAENAAAHGGKASGGVRFGSRISTTELALFLRQLATLVNADVPLAQCLTILERQSSNGPLGTLIHNIREDVQGGTDFSRALSKYPKTFTPMIVSMARVGETGGVLGPILEQVAMITERDQQIKGEVRAAMIYPIFVIVFGGAVVSILMTFVVPKLTDMFADMGGQLPTPTKILLTVSHGMKSYGWMGLVAIVAAFVGLKVLGSRPEGKLQIDTTMLKLPLVGSMILKASIARFSRALGVLLGGGVPLLEALTVVKGVLGNAALGQTIEQAAAGLREGASLARELEKSNMFPPMVTHMTGIGENSGTLDTMLVKIAETYEWQTQQAIKTILALVAPVMILILAVVVGFIAMAMILPIFKMNQLVR